MIKKFIIGFLHFLFFYLSSIFSLIVIPILILEEKGYFKLKPDILYGFIIIIIWLISAPFIFGYFIKYKYKINNDNKFLKQWAFGLKHLFITIFLLLVCGVLLQIPFALVLVIINFIYKLNFNKINIVIFSIIYFPLYCTLLGYLLNKTFYKKIRNNT